MISKRDLLEFKNLRGLVETTDDEVDKPLFRRPGFDGVVGYREIEEKLAASIREKRESEGLTRAEFASLVGLSTPVYGRYERAFSSLTVARLIHLCKLFGIQPIELIFDLAPHLCADTREEVDDRRRLIKLGSGPIKFLRMR